MAKKAKVAEETVEVAPQIVAEKATPKVKAPVKPVF